MPIEGQNPALKAFSEKLTDAMYPDRKPGHCLECNEPFSDKNVLTDAGKRETQLSQLCEICWNKLFPDDEE